MDREHKGRHGHKQRTIWWSDGHGACQSQMETSGSSLIIIFLIMEDRQTDRQTDREREREREREKKIERDSQTWNGRLGRSIRRDKERVSTARERRSWRQRTVQRAVAWRCYLAKVLEVPSHGLYVVSTRQLIAVSTALRPTLYRPQCNAIIGLQLLILFYLFSSSTSNGIEVQAKNILAERPTQG